MKKHTYLSTNTAQIRKASDPLCKIV